MQGLKENPQQLLLQSELEMLSMEELQGILSQKSNELAYILNQLQVNEENVKSEIDRINQAGLNDENSQKYQQLNTAQQIQEKLIAVNNEIKKRTSLSINSSQIQANSINIISTSNSDQNNFYSDQTNFNSNQNYFNSDQNIINSEQNVLNQDKITELDQEISNLAQALNSQIHEQNFENIQDLDESITDFQEQLSSAIRLKKMDDQEYAQQQLDILLPIRAIQDKIVKLQSERENLLRSTVPQSDDHISALTQQYELLLKQQGLEDIEALDGLIKDYNDQLQSAIRLKIQDDQEYAQKELDNLLPIRQLYDKLTNLRQDKVEKPIIDQINDILIKVGFENLADFQQYFKDTQNRYESAKRPQDKERSKKRFEELQPSAAKIQKLCARIEEEEKKESYKIPEQQTKINLIEEIEAIQEQQQSEDEVKKQQLLEFSLNCALGVKQMNDCFEKSCINLLYYISIKLAKSEDTIYQEKNVSNKIKEYIELLKAQVEEENIQDRNILNYVNQIFALENEEKIVECLIQTVNLIKPFSFHELFKLVQEVDKSGEKIKGRDVILLIGTTGSGKSTTVHFLAASKMRQVRVNGIPHIEPSQISNVDLQNVKCSNKAKSETRFVTPVSLSYGFENAILADAPGSEDTQSAEIEFSNIIGIKNAIGQARTFRPLILFSFKNVGNRMEKLKDLMHYYGQMFSDLESNISKFIYAFTNVTESTKGTIFSQLINIKNHLNVQEQQDNTLKLMLRDMLEKAENGLIIEIFPLESNSRTKILDQIFKTKPIQYPSEVIQSKVSKKSHDLLKRQLNLHAQSIQKALNLYRGDIIIFKLNELRKLIEVFPEDQYYQDHYNECLKIIVNFCDQKYSQAIKIIEDGFKIREELKDEHVTNYFLLIKKIQNFDECISLFLNEKNAKLSADYYTALNQIASNALNSLSDISIKVCNKAWVEFIKKTQLFDKFENQPISQKLVINRFLQQIKKRCDYINNLLMENLDNNLEPRYENQQSYNDKEDFQRQLNQIEAQQNFEESKHKEQFSVQDQFFQFEFASQVFEIQKAKERMSEISTEIPQKIQIYLQTVEEQFKKFLSALNQAYEVLIRKDNQQNYSEDNLQKCVKVSEYLNQFKLAFLQQKSCQFEHIFNSNNDQLQLQLENTMKYIIEQIQNSIKLKDKPRNLQNQYQKLIFLKRLPLLSTSTIETYIQQLINSLSNYIRSQDEEIGKLFEKIQDRSKRDQKHLQKLNTALRTLSQLQWFEQQSQQCYKDALENIEERVDTYIDQLKFELKGKKLGLRDLDNLQMVIRAQTEVLEYQDMLLIASIKSNRDDSIGFKNIVAQIQQTIDHYNKTILSHYEEKIMEPLDIFEHKQLEDYNNYLQILQDPIFEKEIKCADIMIRIQDLVDKQYKIIIEQFQSSKNEIESYCKGAQLDNDNVCQEIVDKLYKVLQITKELSENSNYEQIYLKIDKQSNLRSMICICHNKILEIFRSPQFKNEQANPAAFMRAYTFLGMLRQIDNHFEKPEFSNEYESWKIKLQRDPQENDRKILEMLKIKDYYGINKKIKIFEDMDNSTQIESALLILRGKVQDLQKELAKEIKFEEVKSQISNIIETVQELQQIESIIDQDSYKRGLCIPQSIKSFTTRLIRQAREYLVKSQKQKISNNYDQCFKYINASTALKDVLKEHTDAQIEELEELIKVEQDQLLSQLDGQIQKYLTLDDISKYNQEQPKKLYEILGKIEDDEGLKFQKQLGENINVNLMEYLKKLQDSLLDKYSEHEVIAKKFLKLSNIKDSLINEWWQQIAITYEEVQAQLEEKKVNDKYQEDEIMKSNNLSHIIDYLSKRPNLQKKLEIVKKLKNLLPLFIQDCENKLSQKKSQEIIQLEKKTDSNPDQQELLDFSPPAQTLKQYNNLKPNEPCKLSIEDGVKSCIQFNQFLSKEFISDIIDQQDIEKHRVNKKFISDLMKTYFDQILQMFYDKKQFNQTEEISYEVNIKNFSVLVIAFRNLEQDKDICQDEWFKKYFQTLQKHIEQINELSKNRIAKIFNKIQQNINKSKQEILNITEFNQNLNFLYQIDLILKMIRNQKIIEELTLGQQDDFLNGQPQQYLIQDFVDEINEILEQIDNEFQNIDIITELTKQSQMDRKNFYCKIQRALNFVKAIRKIDSRIYTNFIQDNRNEYDITIKAKIIIILNQTFELSNVIGENSINQMKEFFEKFVHIKSIEENIPIYKSDLQQTILQIEKVIQNKIQKIFDDTKGKIRQLPVPEFSDGLLKLQRIKEHFEFYREDIKSKILELLNLFKNLSNTAINRKLLELNINLKQHSEGQRLIQETKYFDGIELCIWNQKVQQISIENILDNLKGQNLDKKKLELRYNQFIKEYKESIYQSLTKLSSHNNKKESDFDEIMSKITQIVGQKDKIKWTKECQDNLPSLMAYIFTIWTMTYAEHYFNAGEDEKDREHYLRMPHAAQIIAIFRLMGLGYTRFDQKPVGKLAKYKEKVIKFFGLDDKRLITDNLAQIQTGEGKSIVLAIVAIIFALYGFEVRVASYSKDLSMRDYSAFQPLFSILRVNNQIKYETFHNICEEYISKDGNIRELFLAKILKDKKYDQQNAKNQKPFILLIDEVDTFFSKEFYGQQYRPQATIQHKSVGQLLDHIWDLKQKNDLSNPINLAAIKKSQQFKNCSEIFNPQYTPLLDEAVKDMICDIQDFYLHNYILKDGHIGYKDQDQISFNITYGYKTTFAYYQEHERGNISNDNMQKQKTIGINLGEYLYSEIPNHYSLILGVTGTLEQLTVTEKQIINEQYNIINFTLLPSVYSVSGQSQIKWDKEQNVDIEKQSDEYFYKITKEIKKQFLKPRAVIVFFKDEQKMLEFKTKQQQDLSSYEIQILSERLTFSEKEDNIKKATQKSVLTLATRSFGRGTDFICRDSSIEVDGGGIHILLTFFSTEYSEQVQLMGRTGRQGNSGSISMVLHIEDLSQFDFYEKDMSNGDDSKQKQYYQILNDSRAKLQNQIHAEETKSLENKEYSHNKALEIAKLTLENGKDLEIFNFLKNLNLGRELKSTKTLIMMDATGSMSSLINKTKNAVSKMFEDASKILNEKKINSSLVEIQFGCYRNYGSKADSLLEYSPWQSNPQILTQWMERIQPSGGEGNEAVEIGLWHANQEAERGQLSQVFIIGDAPPNTNAEVLSKRKRSNQKWENTPFRSPTYYEQECKLLKDRKIKVFTYYVNESAKNAFQEIADATGAKCQFLDVNSDKGKNILIELFVSEILRKVGNDNGNQGELLVQAYKAYKDSQQ